MTPQIAKFERMIREKLPTYGSPQAAADALRDDISGFVPISPEMEADLAGALRAVEASLHKIEILRRNSLAKIREDWYRGPKPSDQHWPAVKGFLENTKNWDHESIQSIDASSTEIVSLLANPARDQFRCRGLVVGYVQSGKTANMTAVIAKAVDAGYNFIVLLGGVTKKLRVQTQRRIEKDIVERHRELWQLYTESEEGGDFSRPANRQFTMPVQGRAQLAVIKKETRRLAAFLGTIEHTPPTVLRALKTLIIDDECDQASVNAASNDNDITRINERIRRIIRALPAVSYVGYTATPFANVFIEPFPHNQDELNDLYPEDFITDLPRPADYFGAREVFGFDPDDAESEEGDAAGLDMIRIIPVEEVALIRSTKRDTQATFLPKMTPQLERAVLWFLVTCAIRRHRGQGDAHMTMLVHTSQYVVQHDRMAGVIKDWLTESNDALLAGVGAAWDALADVWEEETGRVPLTGNGELNLAELRPHLSEVVRTLEVVVENGQSVERLDYADTAKTYIVVGGSVLARGLTLEGLAVSFFLRTSQQYDTLLQMGRWFGFRKGYADLPRLWTTSDLAANFRALARIEEEIREDIAVYRDRNATPLDFAVRVRSIPGMAITAAAKMRHAYRTSISFEGKHVQTIRFDHRSARTVADNWSAASRLVDECREQGEYNAEIGVFASVPFAVVRQFLVGFNICDQHLDLKRDMLLGYLDQSTSDLESWNVGVVTPREGTLSTRELGFLGRVHTNKRSRLPEPEDYADIKALMSKRDILLDADDKTVAAGESWPELKARRPQLPLLLVYPIEAKSEPVRPGTSHDGRPTRVPLDAVGDLIGIGIVFPGSPDRAGGYYSVELDVPTPEQLEEDEEEQQGG